MSLYDDIANLLRTLNVPYSESSHEPVFTSAQAAEVSGHEDDEGTKSLALKSKDGRIIVATVAGSDRIDFKRVQSVLGSAKVSMCDAQTLSEKLGVEVGGVVPFGYGEEVQLVVAPSLFDKQRVHINPGRNDVTISLAGCDFKRVMIHCKAKEI